MKQIFVNFSEILRWHNFPFDPTLLGRCRAPVFFMVLTRLGPLFIYKRILFFAETFAVSLTPSIKALQYQQDFREIEKRMVCLTTESINNTVYNL